jgi:hypothetical protein
MKPKLYWTLFLSLIAMGLSETQAETLSRYNPENMEYLGAFRLPHGTFGDARTVDSPGAIEVDEKNGRFFMVGNTNKSIAEFRLPDSYSKSERLEDLPMVSPPTQNFVNIISRAENGNPNDVNLITGLKLIQGKLVANAAVYYDGSGSNRDTTLIVENPDDLAGSKVTGFMRLEGTAHSAGWITELPSPYQEIFGKDLIYGYASNISINGRLSIGPTLFTGDTVDLINSKSGETIETNALIDFGMYNKLHPDLSNDSLNNDLWTELSEAYYGFIVPGSRTYFTIGNSGGHSSGIGYKITQPNGYSCGGFCAKDHRDYYNHIWLWDMNDVERSFKGEIAAHEIRPYRWEKIKVPFQERSDNAPSLIIGATTTRSGLLYIVLDQADGLQSKYSTLPIILVYDLFPDIENPAPPTRVKVE